MKPHPMMTIPEILANIKSAGPPQAVGRPTSDAESAAADLAMHQMIDAGKIAFHCIGCDSPVGVQDAAICECGGFVCPRCRSVEEEGICSHERPACLPDEDNE